jgi:branched-subunit amino acid aminotransferase/4-amino-4-deoxychorismate lyase
MGFCFFNNELLPYEKLNFHISDLQFQRGYGVFDYFRSRNGSIPWFDDYKTRLFRSVELAGIDININKQELKDIINQLQKKNGFVNGAYKVIVTGGYSENLDEVTGKSNFLVLNLPWKEPSEESYKNGVNLISDNYIRHNPEIKSLNYFNRLRLHKKLREYQAVDVLYHTNTISETSRANLFFVKGGQIYTPATNMLEGITRKQILKMFPEIRVQDIDASGKYDYDEVFLTSTSREITPVVKIDGKKIGKGVPGPVTMEVRSKFSSILNS